MEGVACAVGFEKSMVLSLGVSTNPGSKVDWELGAIRVGLI